MQINTQVPCTERKMQQQSAKKNIIFVTNFFFLLSEYGPRGVRASVGKSLNA